MPGSDVPRTGAAQRCASAAPPRARVLSAAGSESALPLAAVPIGLLLRVRPGEKIPVDGVIVEGRGTIDESMVTGESMPVPRDAGDAEMAGTVNLDGYLEIRVDRRSDETVLAKVIAAGGWSKGDFRKALFEQARMPAAHLERSQRDWRGKRNWELSKGVRTGRLPAVHHESDDPERLVPIVWEPDDYMIAVTGDPLRNTAYVFAANGPIGYAVGKRIRLPVGWNGMIESRES